VIKVEVNQQLIYFLLSQILRQSKTVYIYIYTYICCIKEIPHVAPLIYFSLKHFICLFVLLLFVILSVLMLFRLLFNKQRCLVCLWDPDLYFRSWLSVKYLSKKENQRWRRHEIKDGGRWFLAGVSGRGLRCYSMMSFRMNSSGCSRQKLSGKRLFAPVWNKLCSFTVWRLIYLTDMTVINLNRRLFVATCLTARALLNPFFHRSRCEKKAKPPSCFRPVPGWNCWCRS